MSYTTEYNQQVTIEQLQERKLFYRGLGVDTDVNESNDSMLKRADLDFNIFSSNVIFKNQDNQFFKSDTQMLSYVDSQGLTKQLGTVSSKWAEMMLQPEAVVKTFKNFCIENELNLQRVGKIERVNKKRECEYHSKLSMFMVADLSKEFSIRNNDPIVAKLLITSPFEYGKGYNVNLLAKRLVCTNGMSQKVHGSSKIMGHTKTTVNCLTKALSNALNSWKNQTESFNLLSEKQLPVYIGLAVLISQFSKSENVRNLASAVTKAYLEKADYNAINTRWSILNEFLDLKTESKLLQTAYRLYHDQSYIGSSLDGSGTSLWGMLNCVTEFYQHHDRYRGADSNFQSLYIQGDRINKVNSFMNNVVSFARLLQTI